MSLFKVLLDLCLQERTLGEPSNHEDEVDRSNLGLCLPNEFLDLALDVVEEGLEEAGHQGRGQVNAARSSLLHVLTLVIAQLLVEFFH